MTSKKDMAQKVNALLSLRESQEAREQELVARVKVLESQLRQANSTLEKRGKDVKRLKEECAAAQEQMKAQENASSEAAEKQREAWEEEMGEVKRMLAEANEKADATVKARHEAEEKRRNAVRAMRKEKGIREEAEQALQEERKKMERFEQAGLSVQKVKKEGEKAMREARAVIDKLQEELETANRRNVEMQERNEILEEQANAKDSEKDETIRTLTEECSKSTSESKQLQQELAHLKNQVQELSEREEKLSKDLQTAHQSERSLSLKSKQQEKELGELKTKLEDVSSQLSKAVETATAAAKDVPELSTIESREESEEQEIIDEEEENAKETLKRITAALQARNISLEFLLKKDQDSSSTPNSSKPAPKTTPSTSSSPQKNKIWGSKTKKSVPVSENVPKKKVTPQAISSVESKTATVSAPKGKRNNRRVHPLASAVERPPAQEIVGGNDPKCNETKYSKAETKSDPKPSSPVQTKEFSPREKLADETSTAVKLPEVDLKAEKETCAEEKNENVETALEPSVAAVVQESCNGEPSAASNITSVSPVESEKPKHSNQQSPSVQNIKRPASQNSNVSVATDTSTSKNSSLKRVEKEMKLRQQRKEEREKIQKQYHQQKLLQQQQQQEKVRKARSRSIERSQRAIAAAAIPEEVDQPSKLEIGVNLFDIAPQTSVDSAENDVEGDINSLLYPRPDGGWKRADQNREEDDKPENLESGDGSGLSTKRALGRRPGLGNPLAQIV